MNIFSAIVLGHLFGDYIFQNNWMAQNKKKDTIVGYIACMVHCTIYTMCVSLMLYLFGYSFAIHKISLLFLSHFIPDKFDILTWWSQFYGIRTWSSEIEHKKYTDHATIKDSINISFGSFVSIVQDNTIHLFLMCLIFCV